MPYITVTLNHNINYTLMATAAVGAAACTVTTIKASGAMSSEILVSPNGARAVPTGAARMIFFMCLPVGQTGTFKITQSGIPLVDLPVGGSAPIDMVVTINVV